MAKLGHYCIIILQEREIHQDLHDYPPIMILITETNTYPHGETELIQHTWQDAIHRWNRQWCYGDSAGRNKPKAFCGLHTGGTPLTSSCTWPKNEAIRNTRPTCMLLCSHGVPQHCAKQTKVHPSEGVPPFRKITYYNSREPPPPPFNPSLGFQCINQLTCFNSWSLPADAWCVWECVIMTKKQMGCSGRSAEQELHHCRKSCVSIFGSHRVHRKNGEVNLL